MARVAQPLTVKKVRELFELRKTTLVDARDGALPGLSFRTSTKSAGWWFLRKGYPRTFLGAYPALGLAEARSAAKQHADKVIEDKVDGLELGKTLLQLCELYYNNSKLRSRGDAMRAIKNVFADELETRAAELTAEKLQACVDKRKDAPYMVAGAGRYLHAALANASKRKLCRAGVVEVVLPKLPRRGKRERVLAPEELKAVWPHLTGPYGLSCRLMLYTLARREEVCEARVKEFHDGVWTVPAARSKNGISHVVVLPRQARIIIAPLLEKRHRESLVFENSMGGSLSNWDRWQKQVFKLSGTEGWHRHDLRRTAATIGGEMEVDPHIIELMLNHIDAHSPLASVYNRARYNKKRADALQAIADRIDQITASGNNGDGNE